MAVIEVVETIRAIRATGAIWATRVSGLGVFECLGAQGPDKFRQRRPLQPLGLGGGGWEGGWEGGWGGEGGSLKGCLTFLEFLLLYNVFWKKHAVTSTNAFGEDAATLVFAACLPLSTH